MCRKEKGKLRIALLLMSLLLCASLSVTVYADTTQTAMPTTQETIAAETIAQAETVAVETIAQAETVPAETAAAEAEAVQETFAADETAPEQETVAVEETVPEETVPVVDPAEFEAAQEAILSLEGNVEDLENAQAEYAKKMVLVYIALGLGAVGILIGVVALVLVYMNRSDEPPIDVSKLATRETAERLDKQNKILKQEVQLQDQKLDEQIRQLKYQQEALKAELERIQKTAQAPVVPNPSPAFAPVPQLEPVKMARKVGYLKLEYQSIAPTASFLQNTNQESEYVLYDDDTVEFVNACPDAINHLSGWNSSGMLYLFNPVLGGVEMHAENCLQYSDYYLALATIRRAKVRQITGGNYVLAEKGSVEMKKA